MKIRDMRNFAAGALFVLFGAATALGALQFAMGTASRMGPGYFPLVVGMLLVLVGLAVAAGAVAPTAPVTSLGGWPFRNVALILGSVVLFGVLLPHVGLLIAASGLIILSGMAHPEWTLRGSVLSAAVLAPATGALFVGLLGLRIPLLPTFF